MGKPKPRLINCSHCDMEYWYVYAPVNFKRYKNHYCPDCISKGIHYNRLHGYAKTDENGRKTNEYEMWADAKKRSKNQDVPFDIEPGDIVITENCPVLGIPLTRQMGKGKPSDNSPTLDKIIPEKGYVKDNIVVVSYKANSMKRNATIEEVVKLADFYKQYL